jgi:thiamine phosphate synthase YjbQ (UPF0047 family)
MAFENITARVEAAVLDSGVREGLVLVNAMHRWNTLARAKCWG